MRKPTLTNQTGRVVLVTGANTGIGKETARELARAGAHVLLACRSEAKALPVVEELRRDTGNPNIEFHRLDLGSVARVHESVEAFRARDLPLHTLINNAGLVTRGTTEDGFELIFGVNHVGHFALTLGLLDLLTASGTEEAPARIVNVSSKAHYEAKEIDWGAIQRPTVSTTGMPEYRVSKLANVLFTAELARRLEGEPVRTYALHPGVVASDIWRRVPWPVRPLMLSRMITCEEGAYTTLHCAATDATRDETGLYYDACARKAPSVLSTDVSLARELWSRSERWTQRAL